MADHNEMQAFLQIMADMKKLSASTAAENITNELLKLRKRDQDNCAIINRLTEDKYSLLQQSKAAADEIQMLNENVDSLQGEVAKTKKKLAEIDKVAKDRGQRLGEETAMVKQLKQYRVDLGVETRGDIGNRWIHLWTLVNQLATDYFSGDLDLDTLRAAHDWEPSTSSQYSKEIPFPATNSKEAKQMRIIAVDSIIAGALTRHIFRPVGMDNGFANAMSDLACKNPDMESFYRSSHLAAIDELPCYRDSIIARAVKAAITQIINSVGQMLPDARRPEFRIHVEGVCRTAEQEWRIFQQYKDRYEVDMAGDEHCYDPVPLWRPAEASSPEINGAAHKPAQIEAPNTPKAERASLLVKRKAKSDIVVTRVWPLLKVVNASGPDPKLSGWALFSNQSKEAEEQVMRANRQANREERKQDEKKSSSRPLSIGTFLQGSTKTG